MRIGILLIVTILIEGCFSNAVKEMEAKKLAEEFFNHPEIREMDDGTRARKYINDIQIILNTDTSKDTSYSESSRYYKEVLIEQGINEKDYEYFKKRLNDTGLRHYYKKDNFSIFVTGGILGDIEGILVVHNNESIPQEGFRLNEHYYIWIGSKIEDDVYLIGGG